MLTLAWNCKATEQSQCAVAGFRGEES